MDSYNIFDEYSPFELRDIFLEPTEDWPEEFCYCVNSILSGQLLDMWLDAHTDDEYRDEIRQIVEDLTYGYEDEDGNEMLEFTEESDNDNQMRLF